VHSKPNVFSSFSGVNEISVTNWQTGKKSVIRNNTSHNLQINTTNSTNSRNVKGNLENESGISSMASNNNEELFDDNEDSSIESLSDSEQQTLNIVNVTSENGQSSND
jgi:hypothetical protein